MNDPYWNPITGQRYLDDTELVIAERKARHRRLLFGDMTDGEIKAAGERDRQATDAVVAWADRVNAALEGRKP